MPIFVEDEPVTIGLYYDDSAYREILRQPAQSQAGAHRRD